MIKILCGNLTNLTKHEFGEYGATYDEAYAYTWGCIWGYGAGRSTNYYCGYPSGLTVDEN